MNIDKCLTEVAAKIKEFLIDEGGYANGYYTYVDGIVESSTVNKLKWMTPEAGTDLTEKGMEKKAQFLYIKLQLVLKEHGVDQLIIRGRDVEHGAMKTEVIYVVETKKRVNLS